MTIIPIQISLIVQIMTFIAAFSFNQGSNQRLSIDFL